MKVFSELTFYVACLHGFIEFGYSRIINALPLYQVVHLIEDLCKAVCNPERTKLPDDDPAQQRIKVSLRQILLMEKQKVRLYLSFNIFPSTIHSIRFTALAKRDFDPLGP